MVDKILAFFPSLGRLAFSVGVVALVLFLLPISIVDLDTIGVFFGIGDFRNWVGILAVVAVTIFLSDRLYALVAWKFNEWRISYDVRNQRKGVINSLHDLTPQEKFELQSYIIGKSQSGHYSLHNAVIQGLVKKGILYQATERPDPVTGRCGFNIHPWMYSYLTKHKQLLLPDQPSKETSQ